MTKGGGLFDFSHESIDIGKRHRRACNDVGALQKGAAVFQ